MRESITEFLDENFLVEATVGFIVVLLMMTMDIWYPIVEWFLRRRDQYRSWRGVGG